MGPAAQKTCPFISLSLFSGQGLLRSGRSGWMKAARYVVALLILGLAVLLFPSGPVKIPPRANLPSPSSDSWFGGPTVSVRAGEDPAACQSALAARRRSNRVEEGRSRSAAKCRTRNVVGFPASLTSRSMEPRRYRRLHGGLLEVRQNHICWLERGLPWVGGAARPLPPPISRSRSDW